MKDIFRGLKSCAVSILSKSFLMQDVPLSLIRHNNLRCYVAEGYGAEPIEKWPIRHFFQKYARGEKEAAIQDFEHWYREQLLKYHAVPKIEGGMYKGSLYTMVEKQCGVPFSEVDEVCRDRTIHERVLQRFQLFENIRAEGYKPEISERIFAFKKGGHVYLEGGHHRAAVLCALGKEVLPRILVFPSQFIYNLVRSR